MANIMINQVCNLRCKYCFADETVNKPGSNCNDMTFEAFQKAIQISGSGRIGIIGGEPTIHPEFEKFMEYAVDHSNGRNIVLFTNGILLDKYWKWLVRPNVSCLWNFNGPSISGAQYEKIRQNADLMFKEFGLQQKITLGLNLYEPDMDYKFFIDTCKDCKVKSVRLAITVPNSQRDFQQDYLVRLRKMKDLLIKVCEELVDVGSIPHLDCTVLPQCIFNESDYERITAFHKKAGVTPNETQFFKTEKCRPVCDIMPDLSITRCFGCSDVKYLRYHSGYDMVEGTYRSIEDAVNVFDADFGSLAYMVPGHKDCVDCAFRKRGVCQGGCLGYKKDKILETMKMMEAQFGGMFNV